MQYNHLPVSIRIQIADLFCQNNFCFVTSSPNRSPTFYFAKGGLSKLNTATLCGRLRTNHPSGPLIDISTNPKGHLFFVNKADRNDVHRKVRGAPKITRKHEINIAAAKYRTEPKEGDFHFEYSKNPNDPLSVSRRHPSGGKVLLPQKPTNVQLTSLIDRLLEDNCQIKIDGVTKVPKRNALVRPIIAGVVPYLQSL